MKMNINIKNLHRLLLISAVLLGFSSVTHAIPTLTFSGDITYDSTSGILSLDGALTGSQEIIPAPDFSSSSISLSTTFVDSVSASGVTVGNFGAGSLTIDDMTTGSDFLLTGDFAAAQMGGADGADQGVLTLVFSPTSGTLMSYFSDPSDLFALTLNLSSLFGEGMFDSSFDGFGNGNITSRKEVYEPGVLSLLVLGVGLIGISGWHRRKQLG
jgi:hypothetical protein